MQFCVTTISNIFLFPLQPFHSLWWMFIGLSICRCYIPLFFIVVNSNRIAKYLLAICFSSFFVHCWTVLFESTTVTNVLFQFQGDTSLHYIACQGPLKTQLENFWRMIVQYQVNIIVMLCQPIEKNKVNVWKTFWRYVCLFCQKYSNYLHWELNRNGHINFS